MTQTKISDGEGESAFIKHVFSITFFFRNNLLVVVVGGGLNVFQKIPWDLCQGLRERKRKSWENMEGVCTASIIPTAESIKEEEDVCTSG